MFCFDCSYIVCCAWLCLLHPAHRFTPFIAIMSAPASSAPASASASASASSKPATPSTAFRVLRSNVATGVLDDVLMSCDVEDDFTWPREFIVQFDKRELTFFSVKKRELLLYMDVHCTGYDSARAYLLLVCKGCPGYGTKVDVVVETIE